MEKLSHHKERCQAKDTRWDWTVLVDNVPWYIREDSIRALFSDQQMRLNSVKFWLLYTRKNFKRFAELEVFSQNDAYNIVRLLDGKKEFGVKLRARQKYPG